MLPESQLYNNTSQSPADQYTGCANYRRNSNRKQKWPINDQSGDGSGSCKKMSITINFYDSGGVFSIANDRLKFAVIAARYQGKWIFCRHKQRDTYEIPGGHREPGEDINDTARRGRKKRPVPLAST